MLRRRSNRKAKTVTLGRKYFSLGGTHAVFRLALHHTDSEWPGFYRVRRVSGTRESLIYIHTHTRSISHHYVTSPWSVHLVPWIVFFFFFFSKIHLTMGKWWVSRVKFYARHGDVLVVSKDDPCVKIHPGARRTIEGLLCSATKALSLRITRNPVPPNREGTEE